MIGKPDGSIILWETYTWESPIQVSEDVATLLIGKGSEKILTETTLRTDTIVQSIETGSSNSADPICDFGSIYVLFWQRNSSSLI